MKKILSLLLFIISLAGCTTDDSVDVRMFHLPDVEFTAVTESELKGTKTILDQTLVLWCEKDEVSIFKGTTENLKYVIKDGYGGSTSAVLKRADDDTSEDEFIIGTEPQAINANVALYPYGVKTMCAESSGSYTLTYFTPVQQTYMQGSFGPGALPMAAVTQPSSSFNLSFRNLAGFIRFQFVGDVTVKSIIVSGNGGEALSGKTVAVCSYGSDPSITVDSSAEKFVTIDCGDGVALSETEPTFFYIAVPPVIFENGITVLVTTDEGTITKVTSKSLQINRSKIRPFTQLRLGSEDIDKANVQFEDDGFKSFCVSNFDKDKDGEISLSEASAVKSMDFPLGVSNFTSLKGLECFVNLEEFSLWSVSTESSKCRFDKVDFSKCPNLREVSLQDAVIGNIDISKCYKLEYINFKGINIPQFDVSHCHDLTKLYLIKCNTESLNLGTLSKIEYLIIWSNKLTSLDLSHCSNLYWLNCSSNSGIGSLDLSACAKLNTIMASDNALKSVDLSGCPKIDYVDFVRNSLTSLDISHNPDITNINLMSNKVTDIDVSKALKLEQLVLQSNKITELDVSANDKLFNLSLAGNPLKTLYVNEYQKIVGITVNRNASFIPSTTAITIKTTGEDEFKVDAKELTFEYTSQNFTLKINSPSTYTITTPSWIKEITTKSSAEHQFSVELNDTYKQRSGTIAIINANNDTLNVTVTQNYGSLDHSSDGKVRILQKASEGKGIDIVLTGDGYCDIDTTTYNNYIQRAYEAFFAEEPFATFKNRFNVYSIMAISDQNQIGSGTKFSVQFTGGTGISGDHNAVFDFVDYCIPGLDLTKTTIIVLINQKKYAGTCWFWSNNQTISYVPHCNSYEQFANTFRHETNGHAFGKMADEYVNSSGEITQNQIDSYNQWKSFAYGFNDNVDINGTSSTVKWSSFLSDPDYSGQVGIYEGALLYAKGAYRATENSIMRYNTGGFNAPTRESLYKRIMLFSQVDGWTYSRQDFLDYDVKNRTGQAAARAKASNTYTAPPDGFAPLHPPVYVEGQP